MKMSEQCLERFNKNKTDFVRQSITMDETWIYHYTPESKQQSKQQTEAGCSAPKKKRSFKVMTLVFWNAEGILFIDYLKKSKTLPGEYYSNLLTRLDEKIHEKNPVCKIKYLLSRQCTCPQNCFGNGKIKGSALCIVGTSPYSLDLAQSDFHLFPKLKLFLSGQHFSSKQEAVCGTFTV
jgi:histone-lysine N-methyltransferase SETMAR